MFVGLHVRDDAVGASADRGLLCENKWFCACVRIRDRAEMLISLLIVPSRRASRTAA